MELPSKEDLAAVAAMTPEERWAKGLELNEAYRQSVLRDVEAEHPDWSPEDIRNLWRRRLLTESFKDEPIPPCFVLDKIYPLP